MKKYLGNKSKIVNVIYTKINELLSNEEKTLFDAFSGTTNVGRYFKEKGFSVISNDITDVSYVLGKAYIESNDLPCFSNFMSSNTYSCERFKKLRNTKEFLENKDILIKLNSNTNDSGYLESIYDSLLIDFIVYLTFYCTQTDFINTLDDSKFKINHPDFIYRNYCDPGSNSSYVNLVTNKSLKSNALKLEKISQRLVKENISGFDLSSVLKDLSEICIVFRSFDEKPYNINKFDSGLELLTKIVSINFPDNLCYIKVILESMLIKLNSLRARDNHIGHRMFFSPEHGVKIDIILNTIVYWFKNTYITETEYYILLSSLLEAVALFSNTSATYQAFYKQYRDNTQQPFRLIVPEVRVSQKDHYVYQADTFDLIKNINVPYDILYLDPPYNWRIYDSNYHLLNFIAKYHTIEDIETYETEILGAAGENRSLKRNYTNFNRRETFEQYLFEPIKNAKCKYIAISYSNSESNHNKQSKLSVQKISKFLKNKEMFEEGSFQLLEIDSQNFESRKNEKKEAIKELLFLAKKVI